MTLWTVKYCFRQGVEDMKWLTTIIDQIWNFILVEIRQTKALQKFVRNIPEHSSDPSV